MTIPTYPEPINEGENTVNETETPVFDQWCIVELFGHQRYAGRIRQAEWPPGFARLEVPATPGCGPVTQLLSPQSIYRLTPTTEEIATAVAAECRPEPVSRWELAALPAAEVPPTQEDIDPADELVVEEQFFDDEEGPF